MVDCGWWFVMSSHDDYPPTTNQRMRVIAVLGVADHNGWAVCVTVAASRGAPVVVDRRRIDLIEPGVPSQPYHHETVGMPLPEAETLVVRVRESVMRTTVARLTDLRKELESYSIVTMTIRNPPLSYVPVTVAQAHESYPVMCRADGMMYHDALCTAARRLSIAVELDDRGDAIVRAADRLGVSVEALERFLRTTGESLGPPWQKEHRLAAAAAIGVLGARTRVSLSV
jgi:hypothetical protein